MTAPVIATRGQALDAALAAAPADGQTAQDLLDLAQALAESPYLRRALTNPAAPAAARQRAAYSLLGSRVGPGALAVALAAVAQSWSDADGLRRALERQGIRACWLWADSEGRFTAAVDGLFAFGQLVAGDRGLRRALTDFTVSAERRRGLVRRLLEGRVQPAAVTLAEQAATASVPFEDAVARSLGLAGQLKGQTVARAVVASPLGPGQRARLTAALAERSGRPVVLEEIVDPTVLGGVRVEIGDDVIDGTVAARLETARRHLT
ncbi:MAG: F0F1 ATP synthase subunit delta [Propionibacteriaceae bacterium]|jgi:F-type H+-transporting ATPase subunit delta|nr:F0F1 ATP synthase subunit delta [Propionibacteriaceae bacterium]